MGRLTWAAPIPHQPLPTDPANRHNLCTELLIAPAVLAMLMVPEVLPVAWPRIPMPVVPRRRYIVRPVVAVVAIAIVAIAMTMAAVVMVAPAFVLKQIMLECL